MSADEETTPLVWEDDTSTRQGVCKRRAVCVGTVCLSLGLCVAIIVPLTLTASTGATTDLKQDTAYLKSKPFNLQVIVTSDWPTPKNSTSSNSTTQTTVKTTIETTGIITESTTPLTPPPSYCPRVSESEHGTINLEYLNKSDQVWYELYRIQTRGSPAYIDGIACSTMQLNFTSEEPSNGTINGTVILNWEEGRYYRRQKKSITLELHEDSPLSEWIEEDPATNQTGVLSLVTYLHGHLLTYECFPGVPSRRRPGYVIHIYSVKPSGHLSIIAEAMLELADIWGLNPAQESATFIRQHFCDFSSGQA